MRLIRRILTIVVTLALLLVLIAFLLPNVAQVERSIAINATAEAIFPQVNSMQKSEAWSPWLSRDPATKLTYEGPDVGVGNKLTWASENPQVGNGSQTITSSTPNERVETALDFGAMGTASAYFTLRDADNATDVTWGFTTNLGMNPISRWMGLMMDNLVGPDYEKGLANLKALVEAQ